MFLVSLLPFIGIMLEYLFKIGVLILLFLILKEFRSINK